MSSGKEIKIPHRGLIRGQQIKPLPRGKPQRHEGVKVAPCLKCGESYWGPKSIRLRHGRLAYHIVGKTGQGPSAPVFTPLKFEDGEKEKWLCLVCAYESGLMPEEDFRFLSILRGLSTAQGWCPLCSQSIEPWPHKDWSSTLLLESGFVTKAVWKAERGDIEGSSFEPMESGFIHYTCSDEIGLEMWRLVASSDEPDFSQG